MGGYRTGNRLAVKASVFDKDLIGVHARNNNTCKVDTLALALESFRVGIGPLGLRFQCNPHRCQKLEVGLISGEREYKIVLYCHSAVGSFHVYRLRMHGNYL